VDENTNSINNLAGQVNENKQNISNLGDRINNINSTINNVVGDQVRNINNRVDGVENRVNQLDNKVNHLDNKISNVDKRASRGIATVGAMGMLPQPHISGRSMMAAATTSYRGQQALAVGYSRLSDNGKHIIKFSGASNLSGKKDAMVGAAYGYQW
jgi:putative autotransporter adhesin